jgi:hypothetical protein
MHVGDITTKVAKKPNSSFMIILEKDWLQYLGFTDKELDGDEIEIVFKAEISDHKKFAYIGFGKPGKRE